MNANPPTIESELIPWSTAEALLDDLTALTEIHEVRMKGAEAARAGAPTRDLAGARAALAAGRALAVQIRYGYDGLEWCDTLVRERDGVRIVRITLPRDVAA